jgi:hypothetical protein
LLLEDLSLKRVVIASGGRSRFRGFALAAGRNGSAAKGRRPENQC